MDAIFLTVIHPPGVRWPLIVATDLLPKVDMD
jgi:hypothetical protein